MEESSDGEDWDAIDPAQVELPAQREARLKVRNMRTSARQRKLVEFCAVSRRCAGLDVATMLRTLRHGHGQQIACQTTPLCNVYTQAEREAAAAEAAAAAAKAAAERAAEEAEQAAARKAAEVQPMEEDEEDEDEEEGADEAEEDSGSEEDEESEEESGRSVAWLQHCHDVCANVPAASRTAMFPLHSSAACKNMLCSCKPLQGKYP